MKNLTANLMLQALASLDQKIPQDVTLILGGGGALILAHGLTLATADLDAVPQRFEISELDPHVKAVAGELNIATDWLNPYYSTFMHTLPSDYGSRLITVFEGRHLKVLALGKEEMLIMKCFAGRKKDVSHARELLKKGVNLVLVEKHIESLLKKNLPGAEQALDFLDEL